MSGFKTLIDTKISKSTADWDQFDSSASSYIKNRTHYAKTVEVTKDIISEQTVDITDGYIELNGDASVFAIGKNYTVKLNGVEYMCTARYYSESSLLLGNGTIYGDGNPSNNEPFSIDIYPNNGEDSTLYLNTNSNGKYTISIYAHEIGEDIKKLDPKYFPDDVLAQPDWYDNDRTSKACILNKPPIIQNEDGEVCIGSLDDIENAERVITEKNFYEPKNHVVIADENNGYNYIVAMRDGNLVSYVETDYISITTQPTKTTYANKETFDPAGMVVIATAKDGSTREITNYKYDLVTLENGNDFLIRLEEGSKVLTARVNNLTVHDFSLEDFEYIANEDGTYELTAWKGTYNGEPSTRIVIPNSELIIV